MSVLLQVAIFWEGNDEGEKQAFTYAQLLDKVPLYA